MAEPDSKGIVELINAHGNNSYKATNWDGTPILGAGELHTIGIMKAYKPKGIERLLAFIPGYVSDFQVATLDLDPAKPKQGYDWLLEYFVPESSGEIQLLADEMKTVFGKNVEVRLGKQKPMDSRDVYWTPEARWYRNHIS